MSRTYRAKRGDQLHAAPWSFVPKSNPWRGAPETAATYFHSDAYFRDGPRGQIIKEETAWKRRADTREEISRVMNNPDREFMDREGGYRRIIRWYD